MLLQVKSMTDAMRLRQLLLREGIRSEVIQKSRQGSGCTFGLSVAEAHREAAKRAAASVGIRLYGEANDLS